LSLHLIVHAFVALKLHLQVGAWCVLMFPRMVAGSSLLHFEKSSGLQRHQYSQLITMAYAHCVCYATLLVCSVCQRADAQCALMTIVLQWFYMHAYNKDRMDASSVATGAWKQFMRSVK